MSGVACLRCEAVWDAASVPLCPICETERLLAAPDLIREKHDPHTPRGAGSGYRSLLSREFVADPKPFLRYAADRGAWLFDTTHESWSHFTREPLARNAGLGLHQGDSVPDHTLDGLLIADALGRPHAFAADERDVRARIDREELVPLARCARPGCGNLRVPGGAACALHTRPARARPEARSPV